MSEIAFVGAKIREEIQLQAKQRSIREVLHDVAEESGASIDSFPLNMVSENCLGSSPEVESRLRKNETKHQGGLIARDLSLEFKENRQEQLTSSKHQSAAGPKATTKATSKLNKDRLVSMNSLGTKFESPRKTDSQVKKMKIGYSPASKLIVSPFPREPFQQISKLVNGVRDLEKRLISMEQSKAEKAAKEKEESKRLEESKQSAAREKKMEAEVLRLECQLKELSSRLQDMGGPLDAHHRQHTPTKANPTGLVQRLFSVVGNSILNLILLSFVVFVASVLSNSYDTFFTFEQPPT